MNPANVSLYNLKTYIGQAVKFGEESIGSLCVVYQEDMTPTEVFIHLFKMSKNTMTSLMISKFMDNMD